MYKSVTAACDRITTQILDIQTAHCSGAGVQMLSYSCHGDCYHYENIFTECLEYGETNLKNHNAHNSNTLLKITCMELLSKWQLKILKSTCTCSSFLMKEE